LRPPPPVELAGALFTREVDGHWDVFLDAVSRFANVLGPEGIDRFRELGRALGRRSGPPAGDRNHERWEANYRITRVMERLAERAGDGDAVVAVKSRDLSMPYGLAGRRRGVRGGWPSRLSDAGHACRWRRGYDDLDAVGSPASDSAVSPPAPLLEGSKVGHLMGHLSSADAPVRNGFIWYVAVSTFGVYWRRSTL
jgi:hypothetical protein